MEKLKEFRLNLIADVKAEAEENSQYDALQFLETVTTSLNEDGKCPIAVPCYYQRTGRRNRKLLIHGYNYDDFDSTMSIFISDFSGGPNLNTITLTNFDELVKYAQAFIEEAIDGHIEEISDCSDDGYNIAQDIRVNKDEIERYYIYVVSDRKRSDRFNTIKEKTIDGKPLFCRIFDIEYQYDSAKENAEPDNIIIDVKGVSGIKGISCMDASAIGTEYQSYLCVVPGIFLANAYKEYGSRLLESNVRSFLGTKGNINKGIRETILNEPELFFAFNNGITTTSTKIERDSEGRITIFENLQIVNGGQTTVSIYNEWKKNPDSVARVNVPMKLTVSEPDVAKSIVPRISQYANTQNAVKKSDLDSNNEFQKLMERISRNTRIPQSNNAVGSRKWYYERTRNQFQQDPERERNSKEFLRQYDKSRKIDKADFGKYRCMILMLPHRIATSREDCYNKYFKPKVIEKWNKDRDFFNVGYFKETVAAAILYKKVYSEIPKRDWFGNRSSIKAPLTYYSICKLFDMLDSKGYRLNFDMIWEYQSVDDVVIRQIANIAKTFSEYIDRIQANGVLITQWFKREECWNDVKKLTVEMDPEMGRFAIGKSEYENEKKKIELTERKSRDAEDINSIVTMTPAFWKQLSLWYEKNIGPLSAAQLTLVKQAQARSSLNEAQIKKLKVLIESAKQNGFQNKELSGLELKD